MQFPKGLLHLRQGLICGLSQIIEAIRLSEFHAPAQVASGLFLNTLVQLEQRPRNPAGQDQAKNDGPQNQYRHRHGNRLTQ